MNRAAEATRGQQRPQTPSPVLTAQPLRALDQPRLAGGVAAAAHTPAAPRSREKPKILQQRRSDRRVFRKPPSPGPTHWTQFPVLSCFQVPSAPHSSGPNEPPRIPSGLGSASSPPCLSRSHRRLREAPDRTTPADSPQLDPQPTRPGTDPYFTGALALPRHTAHGAARPLHCCWGPTWTRGAGPAAAAAPDGPGSEAECRRLCT